MANLNNVGRGMLFSAALSTTLALFSGGCSPSSPSSYDYNNGPAANKMSVMSNDNIGENNRYGRGADNGYSQLNDWNFNSRMGQKPSGKNSANAVRNDSMIQPSASDGKTIQVFEPDNSEADRDGFVTYILPSTAESNSAASYENTSNPVVNNNSSAAAKNASAYNNQYNTNAAANNLNNRNQLQNNVPLTQTDNAGQFTGYGNQQNNQNNSNNNWRQLNSNTSQQSANDSYPGNRSYHAASAQQPLISQNLSRNYQGSVQSDMYRSNNSGNLSSRNLLQPAEITGIYYDKQQDASLQSGIQQTPVSESKSSPLALDSNVSSMRNNQVQDYNKENKIDTYGNGYATPRIEGYKVESELPQYTAKKDINSQPFLSTVSEKTDRNSQPALNVGRIDVGSGQSDTKTLPAVAEYNRYMNPANVVGNTQELIFNLEQLLKKEPGNLELQMALRYAYAAHGEHDKALQELAMVPLEKQKDSMALARAAILGVKAHESNDPMFANNALSAVKILEDKIADQADLKISNFKICNTVEDFGRYQVIADNALESGRSREVVVYCELENYKYQKNEDDKYFTLLHAEITLYDASLNILEQISEDVRDTPSLNKRKDFFLRGPFKVPTLKPGKYQIVISVEDKIANKRALAARYSFEVKGSGTTKDSSDSSISGN